MMEAETVLIARKAFKIIQTKLQSADLIETMKEANQ